MILAQLNGETHNRQTHSVNRTTQILTAIETLTECWNGVYDITDFLIQLRRTANRLNALADTIENQSDTT